MIKVLIQIMFTTFQWFKFLEMLLLFNNVILFSIGGKTNSYSNTATPPKHHLPPGMDIAKLMANGMIPTGPGAQQTRLQVKYRVVGWGKGVVYLASPGRPTDIGLQFGKACYLCSR